MSAAMAHLVFIPAASVSHLAPAIEVARLLLELDDRLSVTFLVVNPPSPHASSKANPFADLLTSFSSSGATSPSRLRFRELPWIDVPLSGPGFNLAEFHKPQVRSAVAELTRAAGAPTLAGFVVDMFCTQLIDVADEFGVPSYVLYTSSASFLGFSFHLQALQDDEGRDLSELTADGDAELEIPFLVNSLPAKVFPTSIIDRGHRAPFLGHVKNFRRAKGILVNSFEELESHAMGALREDDKIPPVYPIGPILNLQKGGMRSSKSSEILGWLDDQPRSSVVFLCFGSNGSFHEDQVKEMARGIEKSGHRFLWSLRRPQPMLRIGSYPEEYDNPAEVLPEGFLERTAERGKVIGWAPQVEVLAHAAVGGFVTHCGWNSTLEGLWFGVPTAAWPLYAEQQFNAFGMVVEHGLAVEVKMDYRKSFGPGAGGTETVVGAEVVESAVRELMDVGGHRKRVEKVREMSRKAVEEGGSSNSALGRFVGDVFGNIP
ncbi:hypothetical protein SAY86_021993 [Trapa natans]|uniref:Glycosyltransferase n=1 Tax=Trapa natans TaxID=22666 RepID=A0AAN7MDS8_TRANT|nr:hypothetical protein SAY86_021993 [Trapa natans]